LTKPIQIKIIDKKNLFIKWSEKDESIIPLQYLRKHCPCATCATWREKESKSYIPIFNENQIKVSNISVVGSYAISIAWKDGHNTGIYEYAFLKKFADKQH
jgi:DUF971 family protein